MGNTGWDEAPFKYISYAPFFLTLRPIVLDLNCKWDSLLLNTFLSLTNAAFLCSHCFSVRSRLKATLQRPTLPSRLPQEPTLRSHTMRTKRIKGLRPQQTAPCTWDWSLQGTTWTFILHLAHTVNSTTRRATILPRRTPGCRGTEAGWWQLAEGHQTSMCMNTSRHLTLVNLQFGSLLAPQWPVSTVRKVLGDFREDAQGMHFTKRIAWTLALKGMEA